MLRDLWEEQKYIEKPILDEQAFEEIGIVLRDSHNYTLEIKLTLWKNWCFEEVTGIVGQVDYQLKRIRIDMENDDMEYILLDSITAAERM
ncbi:YolD-like family protein [Peribacillus cavernae]|uniref:YolD-like family protein n=1 Tax=Peribacillus cavernae TaxID=1674310 RepID=A0A3S0U6N8_9BACI|nr:YolD-like family protein [Peribacillus cavernae]MDQ0220331.1 hypothetical protein [Peribacillus cavernae]RUQ31984.1 YolD-like family protein [Peribacillus cavernae]